MPVIQVPASYKYICDICETDTSWPEADDYTSDSIPPFWSRLIFRPSDKFEAANMLSYDLLLCNNCTGAASAKIAALIRRD
jgi:hypothetical protein